MVFLTQQICDGSALPHRKQSPLPWAASFVHWFAAGVLAPNTAAQKWAQFLFLPNAVRMPPKPSRLPIDAVAMVLRACRREVVLARALVSSSKFDACIVVRSHRNRIAAKVSSIIGGQRHIAVRDCVLLVCVSLLNATHFCILWWIYLHL